MLADRIGLIMLRLQSLPIKHLTNRKQMKIKKILKRHSPGCFDVEAENGDCFRIQLAFKIEEQWQRWQAMAKEADKIKNN